MCEQMKSNYKLLALAFLFIAIALPMMDAEQQSLGTFKQFDCIDLKQTCANCTYVNVSSIVSPSSAYIFNGEQIMTKVGQNYNMTTCNNTEIGSYFYCTHGDIDGIDTNACVNYDVTSSGGNSNTGFYFIILIISIVIIAFGFIIQDPWITLFGTFGLYFIGIYILTNGINGIRDSNITIPISMVVLGIAAYISIKTGIELMQDVY